jgi:hypothetical protein
LGSERQVKAIEAVFKVFLDLQYHPSLRLGCAQRFVRPLLQGCRINSAREFYRCHVKDLLDILGATLDPHNQIRAEHQLVGRIGAWSIFEPLFVQLEPSELESMEYLGADETPKKLIPELISRCVEKCVRETAAKPLTLRLFSKRKFVEFIEMQYLSTAVFVKISYITGPKNELYEGFSAPVIYR